MKSLSNMITTQMRYRNSKKFEKAHLHLCLVSPNIIINSKTVMKFTK